MFNNRFDHIESKQKLPRELQNAIKKMGRFSHLEIGETVHTLLPPTQNGKSCEHCSQSNEIHRTFCWACFKPLMEQSLPLKETPLTVVVNGTTYRSDQADLPPPLLRLFEQVRQKGFNQNVASQWAAQEGHTLQRSTELKTERGAGNEVSVVRIDNNVFHSDDPSLPPEIRTLLKHVQTNPVTPALMDQLRQVGEKVKYRPANTLSPSDGDINFWTSVRNPAGGAPLRTFPPLEDQKGKDTYSRWLGWAMVGLLMFFLIFVGSTIYPLIKMLLK
ncbi:MAG: hypothetical protein JNK54_02870 [Elusimicrobia bacterium]|nr:hypothetical protein [Elusimicrobiota bacterium]